MRVRNYLYDKRYFKSYQFEVPVIGVGNLTVGGTGKTPHVEYLLRLLQHIKIATLSRGYKRKTSGFVLADASATASTIGDEPYQYFADFTFATVAVCEDRVKGINKLLELKPETEVIVLDDAFQHRPVKPKLNILITDYNRLFYKDYVLPYGRLRESRHGAKRADVVIVSKCSGFLPDSDMRELEHNIHRYTKKPVPVFFTTYQYGQPVAFGNQQQLQQNLIVVTGIARAELFVDYLEKSGFNIIQHLNFPDHYNYKPEDLAELQKIIVMQNMPVSVVTTRKDAARLTVPELQSKTQLLPIYYVPIEVKFLENQAEFDEIIRKTVEAE
ncbi:MAG: tetraacyldisaccharide 4'-kinase [Hymenobacteraceae bacterium]|nr:tetraacyldisaccharide 4'-kinase [Hymenobacteraceae bacterium]MDX5397319.1 tetraacyldisaccharide 4'-kinase [Hymenobacteraceae bacterium]MDX5513397.1 tetraacyldisaccharide 4'-kinase [Hymenobacteraceae bacterium]